MENTTRDPILGDVAEKAFQHIEPGSTGGREVHMKSLMPFQPYFDFWMFVGGVVIGDDVICFVFEV